MIFDFIMYNGFIRAESDEYKQITKRKPFKNNLLHKLIVIL